MSFQFGINFVLSVLQKYILLLIFLKKASSCLKFLMYPVAKTQTQFQIFYKRSCVVFCESKERDILGLRPLNIPFPLEIFFCHRFQHFCWKANLYLLSIQNWQERTFDCIESIMLNQTNYSCWNFSFIFCRVDFVTLWWSRGSRQIEETMFDWRLPSTTLLL